MIKNIPGDGIVAGTNIGPYLLSYESDPTGSFFDVILRYNNIKIVDRRYDSKYSEKLEEYKERAKLDYNLIRQVLLHSDDINPFREQCDFDLIERNAHDEFED